jgi:hypothetical protein
VLRDLFKQVFGENTASNNAGWLRRKLSENPDSVHGQCRSRVVRARDSGAAIWNKPLILLGADGEAADAAAAAAAEAEGQGEAGGCAGGLQERGFVKQEADVDMQEAAGTAPQVRCWRWCWRLEMVCWSNGQMALCWDASLIFVVCELLNACLVEAAAHLQLYILCDICCKTAACCIQACC